MVPDYRIIRRADCTSSTEIHYTDCSICTSKFLQLHGETLKGLQDTFSNVGLFFIDEKSMAGQKIFTMVSKCLKETRPHYTLYKDRPFGNLSVVLFGDFKQLPSICDYPIFKANTFNLSG